LICNGVIFVMLEVDLCTFSFQCLRSKKERKDKGKEQRTKKNEERKKEGANMLTSNN